MKKISVKTISATIALASSFSLAGILCDAQNAHFSIEMDYILMQQCMSTSNFMDQNQFKEKLEACACYVGSLACEYGGDDAKLIGIYAQSKKIENADGKYKKCSEKKEDVDEPLFRNVSKKAIEDAD